MTPCDPSRVEDGNGKPSGRQLAMLSLRAVPFSLHTKHVVGTRAVTCTRTCNTMLSEAHPLGVSCASKLTVSSAKAFACVIAAKHLSSYIDRHERAVLHNLALSTPVTGCKSATPAPETPNIACTRPHAREPASHWCFPDSLNSRR